MLSSGMPKPRPLSRLIGCVLHEPHPSAGTGHAPPPPSRLSLIQSQCGKARSPAHPAVGDQ